eukprot:tig00001234_g7735.t1
MLPTPSFSGSHRLSGSQQHEPSLESRASDYELVCKLDDVKTISKALAAVQWKKDQIASVHITKNGLRFTVEEGRCVQCRAFFQHNIFANFHFRKDQLDFRINLNMLLECLNIFQGASSLEMVYAGQGHPLSLLLTEGETVSECGLRTLQPGLEMDLSFRRVPIQNKATLNSEILKEAFQDLEPYGGAPDTPVTVCMSPDSPFLKISTSSPYGDFDAEFPMLNDRDQFMEFESQTTQTFSYQLSMMQPSIKALSSSTYTKIRINAEGVLSMQHMIQASETAPAVFVDFLILPNEE